MPTLLPLGLVLPFGTALAGSLPAPEPEGLRLRPEALSSRHEAGAVCAAVCLAVAIPPLPLSSAPVPGRNAR